MHVIRRMTVRGDLMQQLRWDFRIVILEQGEHPAQLAIEVAIPAWEAKQRTPQYLRPPSFRLGGGRSEAVALLENVLSRFSSDLAKGLDHQSQSDKLLVGLGRASKLPEQFLRVAGVPD